MSEKISLLAVLQILAIDIVLSGDNAVVIAMAARSLPAKLQRRAIWWGGAAAIGLRIVITALVAYLLNVPFLQLTGGLFLIWVAFKLLTGQEGEHEVKAGANLRDAVTTIVVADIVMSLDNMLAVGGASHGNFELLLMGLVLSMGIIMFFSGIIAKLMNKYNWLIYIGAGILAWTASGMIREDRWLSRYVAISHPIGLAASFILTAIILGAGLLVNQRAAGEAAASKDNRR